MGEWLEAGRLRSWSTQDVDPRRALAYWTDAVYDHFLKLEVNVAASARTRFNARLDLLPLGPATLSFLDAEGKRVNRTAAHIARNTDGCFILLQLRSGQQMLRQAGAEVHLRSGECVLVNGSEPYELDCPRTTSAAALRMPEDWLSRWLPRAADCTMRPITGSDWGAALCAALGSLRRETCSRLALPPAVVGEQIAALLALAVGGPDAQAPHGLLDSLTRTLRDRMQEVDLSPAAVAQEHGISRRTLYYAFAAGRTTFADQLMQLRLGKAREILADPRRAGMAIEDVAAGCGFADPSHFARRFRQRFGQSPLQFRRAVLRSRH